MIPLTHGQQCFVLQRCALGGGNEGYRRSLWSIPGFQDISIDKESGRVVVKIIDSATQELVRRIPMEEMLVLAKALGRLKGLLLYTKA